MLISNKPFCIVYKKMNTGEIIGTVLGSVIALGLIIFTIVYFLVIKPEPEIPLVPCQCINGTTGPTGCSGVPIGPCPVPVPTGISSLPVDSITFSSGLKGEYTGLVGGGPYQEPHQFVISTNIQISSFVVGVALFYPYSDSRLLPGYQGTETNYSYTIDSGVLKLVFPSGSKLFNEETKSLLFSGECLVSEEAVELTVGSGIEGKVDSTKDNAVVYLLAAVKDFVPLNVLVHATSATYNQWVGYGLQPNFLNFTTYIENDILYLLTTRESKFATDKQILSVGVQVVGTTKNRVSSVSLPSKIRSDPLEPRFPYLYSYYDIELTNILPLGSRVLSVMTAYPDFTGYLSSGYYFRPNFGVYQGSTHVYMMVSDASKETIWNYYNAQAQTIFPTVVVYL